MTGMTSRERVLAAIQRRVVDYVPCSPFFNVQDRVQRLGHQWQQRRIAHEKREQVGNHQTNLGAHIHHRWRAIHSGEQEGADFLQVGP